MKNQEIIKGLKAQGYKVTVSHFRISTADFQVCKQLHEFGMKNWKKIQEKVIPSFELRSYFSETGYDISARGGRTEVSAEKGDKLYYGIAECSLADNYCRQTGIQKALGRLISVMQKNEA